ncbi:Glyoxalase/Bleomycin resistance protein/Dihydroxybiphenyl dioxygenase [Plectosphaerella plurivora]|uniref:Glyoxalase/Bleomycin resistance protein/Dihydroxybiphenyl dioxygenase n=1 Tax=Plectosphaerella plurivora TaxID=936078 RepID=A0A9P8VLZ3_9PEZI|nr:Glyoxalase/Bleomycin resistance protein/Dihydroxybiphenyl dioxygenase [Plectosphaerella plurivora]
MSPTTNFNDPGTKTLSPAALAHVVLRTRNFEAMQEFYLDFLGGSVTYANEVLSFITYDEEHHRIALLGIPDTAPKAPTTCGLEHMAFSFPTLADLLLSYRQRRHRGISPVWCVNHGPTSSIYYKDPDGNMLETQVDNFDTVDEATAFMMSPAFAENPIGTDFDAEAIIAKLEAGEDEKVLKKRVEIGAREMPDLAGL